MPEAVTATEPRSAAPRSGVTLTPAARFVRLRSSVLVPALMSAFLLWLCHFPASAGWLAWVALVPLLSLVRRPITKWRFFLGTWSGGLLFFLAAMQWMRVADPRMYFTWIGLSLYCSLYFSLGLGLVRFLDGRTRLPLVITLPVVWTALEYLRGWLFTGFPWYFLAHTQHDFGAVIQIADLTGAYGVTFVVAAGNAVTFEWLCRWRRFADFFAVPHRDAPWRPLAWQSAAFAMLLTGVLGYGLWRLSENEFTPGPRVALIQSNMPQSVRNGIAEGNEDPGEIMLSHVTRLTDRALLLRPDLIVWPETSDPDVWTEIGPQTPSPVSAETARDAAQCLARAGKLTQRWPTHLLLGVGSEVWGLDGRMRRYNSAVLLVPGYPPAGRYDKMHRVPFGEYVPLREWLPFMNSLAPYDFDYSIAAGEQFTRFTIGDFGFGAIICFEDSDPALARQYVNDQPVDFLVNISNDGWFKGTSEHEEHLAISRFRAVECRRAVVRAVNLGISAVIDGNGRVLSPEVLKRDGEFTIWKAAENGASLPVARWGEFKSAAGVLAGVIPIDHRHSLYAQLGDWFPVVCCGLLALALLIALRRQRPPAEAPQGGLGHASGEAPGTPLA